MESPIRVEEVLQTIKILKPNKWPGPYGLPAANYKKFAETLAPLLVEAYNSLYNSLLCQGGFGKDTLIAIISMILTCTDMTSWSNYRPISLLNIDIKLF